MSKYIVLDLEMCKVLRKISREGFSYTRELIQIGAVELNDNWQVERIFMSYVKPEYGKIDPVISRLTGISYSDIHSAPTSNDALKAFCEWLPKDGILVTWSENDINQIDDELYFKNIDLPDLYNYLDNYVDCQELFAQKMDREKRYNLKEALSISNIEYDENLHDALVDAKNTALLFTKVQTEEYLVLSPYYKREEELALYKNRYALCC